MTEDEDALRRALEAMLPPVLTPEQRARFAGVFAIVRATTTRLPRPADEFAEPAPVFDMPVREAMPDAARAAP